jgi:hypothetical protein
LTPALPDDPEFAKLFIPTAILLRPLLVIAPGRPVLAGVLIPEYKPEFIILLIPPFIRLFIAVLLTTLVMLSFKVCWDLYTGK